MSTEQTEPTGRDVTACRLSVVAPMFNEAAVIEQFCRRVLDAVAPLVASVELVLVDDGSSDDTLGVVSALARQEPRVRVLALSRNFGHQPAVTAGMDNATGDCVVVIDSDRQDPPEVISDLLRAWASGGDVVHAVRTERQGESRSKRALASSFYRTIGRLTDIELVPDSGDFRLYDRRAVDALRAMPERQRFLRGMAAWVGYRQVRVPYRRDARAAGTSKYPIRR
jgi:dolichol-phosphate mannosyltransferase